MSGGNEGGERSQQIAVSVVCIVGIVFAVGATAVLIPAGVGADQPTIAAQDPMVSTGISVDTASPVGGPGATSSLSHVDDEDGERPMAEAGLDQEANVRAPVYLDAGGSYAPEGEIESYEWEIERPDGTTTTPECESCVRTTFTPQQVGTYAVSVTVTATNGLSDDDTMFVEVLDRDPPTARLDGPDTGEVGEAITLSLDASPGTHPLMAVSWYVDDEISHSDFLDTEGPWEESMVFDAPGQYIVTADVVDESGLWAADDHVIDIQTEGPFFQVTITDTTSPVGDDEDLDVTAIVENVGDEPDTQSILLETDAGLLVDVAPSVSLDPGESAEVSMTWRSCLDASVSSISVTSDDHADQAAVEITEAGCEGGFFAVEDVSAPAVADGGDTIPVEATITNTGDVTDTQLIVMEDLDGQTVPETATTLTLDPDETAEVELEWETDHTDAGEGEIAVRSFDDRATTFIQIRMPPFYEVTVEDVLAPELDDDGDPLPGAGIDVVATIENVGEQRGHQDVVLMSGTNDNVRDTERNVRLDPGERTTLTLTWDRDSIDFEESYLVTVASDDDSDTGVLSFVQDRVYEVAYDLNFPDAMHPGQEIHSDKNKPNYFTIPVKRYDVYYDDNGEYLYHEKADNTWHMWKRGYINTNTDWDYLSWKDDEPINMLPKCNDKECDYDAFPYLSVDEDAEIGETVDVCIEPWLSVDEDGTRSEKRYPSSSTERGDFGLYDTICYTIEIVERDDDRVFEGSRIEVELFDGHGNLLGQGEGSGYLAGEPDRSTNDNGLLWWRVTRGYYEVDVEADDSGITHEFDFQLDDQELGHREAHFEDILPTGGVEIEVIDKHTSQPVEGARVVVETMDKRTDADGEVKFEDVDAIEQDVFVEYNSNINDTTVIVKEDKIVSETIEIEATTTGTLTTRVYDLQENGVEDATVQIGDEITTTTNENGMVNEDVDPGSYTVVVSKWGQTETRDVQINIGQTKQEDFYLDISGGGDLQVTVENEWGQKLSGVDVEHDDPTPEFEGVTTFNGEVEFEGVTEGTYDLLAYSNGNEGTTSNVEVNDGETTEVTILIWTEVGIAP